MRTNLKPLTLRRSEMLRVEMEGEGLGDSVAGVSDRFRKYCAENKEEKAFTIENIV